jgi:hypothetical protein
MKRYRSRQETFLANFYLFHPIHSGDFHGWLADRMLTDDDWKDEEKGSTGLIPLPEIDPYPCAATMSSTARN